jgi:hypothetical protein
MHAGQLCFAHRGGYDEDDWLLETENRLKVGTSVMLRLDPTVTYGAQDIFKKFEEDDGATAWTRLSLGKIAESNGRDVIPKRSVLYPTSCPGPLRASRATATTHVAQ